MIYVPSGCFSILSPCLQPGLTLAVIIILNVKAEFDNVAVAHFVSFALGAHETSFLDCFFGTEALEVGEIADLGGDKAALKVGVDGAGGLWGETAFFDGPGAAFFLPCREEALETEGVVGGLDKLAEGVFSDAVAFQEFFTFFSVHASHFFFEFSVDEDGLSRRDKCFEFVFKRIVGETLLVDVKHIYNRFVGEVLDEIVGGVFFALGGNLGFGFFVGKLKLEIDDVDVVFGLTNDVFFRFTVGANDVVIDERADNVADGVTFADMGEEFVAEAFAFAGASDEAGDVDKFDRSRDDFVGFVHFGEDVEAVVRNRHNTDDWLDGSKRIVRGERTSVRERIKQRRLSDVG